jgi:hypothetical protein
LEPVSAPMAGKVTFKGVGYGVTEIVSPPPRASPSLRPSAVDIVTVPPPAISPAPCHRPVQQSDWGLELWSGGSARPELVRSWEKERRAKEASLGGSDHDVAGEDQW